MCLWNFLGRLNNSNTKGLMTVVSLGRGGGGGGGETYLELFYVLFLPQPGSLSPL